MISSNFTDSSSGDSLLHIAAAQNQVKIIEEVYKREPGLAKKLIKAGVAPLHVAIANGHQEVTEYLLEHTPCSPAMIVSAKGNTALHSACQYNQEAIAEYLITQSTPDFLLARNKRGILPIHFAATQGNLKLVKMLSEYVERLIGVPGKRGSGWTPLHCAAEAGHVKVAKYYCSQRSFKLQFDNLFSPLHSAAIHGKRSVLEYLLRSGKFHPDMPSGDFDRSNSLHLAAYHGHTDCCQLLIDDYKLSPMDTTLSGFTAVDLAAASGNVELVKYMTEAMGYLPCDHVSLLRIATCYGNAAVISWLLSTGKCDPNTLMQNFFLDEDLAAFTYPLHIAARRGYLECVRALTAHNDCDVNVKNSDGETPFDCLTTQAISWELIKAGAIPSVQTLLVKTVLAHKYRFLRSWSAILPSVRLFVVGASEAGKSTLVKALQNEDHWIKGRFIPVEGVEMHTSGVIPVNYKSSAYGKVTIYDFAGHEEYYFGHEALLNKTGHSLPIFFIVIDLQNQKEELKRQISYWRGFIMQATCTSNVEPKIMVLGSHCDLLRQQEKSSKEALLHETCQSDEETRWLTIDCRMSASGSMTKLHRFLEEHCKEAKSSLHIHRHAQAFAAFLKHTIKIACQQYYVEQSIDVYGPPVTDFKEEVEELLRNLNNCGSILYLPNKNIPGESWIILDQETILHGIHGYQKRAKAFDSKLAVAVTGVVSLQELRELFLIPGCDLRLIIRYLKLMEFCHEIDNQEALTKTSNKMNGRYFFFPDLVETEAPLDMWLEDERMTCYSGFVFRCHSPEDFITPRFVQVLLLRIAFELCALAGITNEEITLKNCRIWKNGIYWATLGVETIVELTEGRRSLLVVCRSEERNKLELVRHRTAVLEMVCEVVKVFPRLSIDKVVLHPQNCQPRPAQFSEQVKVYSFKSIFRALTIADKPS